MTDTTTTKPRSRYVLKSVRDPIYGYIYLTPIEQTLIDTPVFQRLRHVLQQSAAYQTFPSNVTTRFPHSLGSMHLAGEMFKHALQNATTNDLCAFLGDAKDLIKMRLDASQEDQPRLEESAREHLGNACGFGHRPLHANPFTISEDERLTINILWQSVRLATLIHDLGHLPFSHIFEDVLREFQQLDSEHISGSNARNIIAFHNNELNEVWAKSLTELPSPDKQHGKTRALHERLGIFLATQIRKSDGNPITHTALWDVTASIAKYALAISGVAFGDQSDDSWIRPLRTLHLIISGEIDADRLDYSVRDPVGAGIELGAIDVHKIIRGIVLHRLQGKKHYILCASQSSIQEIESFFNQRYLTYRRIVDHHNVARSNALCKSIIHTLLKEIHNPTSILLPVLIQHRFCQRDGQSVTFIPLVTAGETSDVLRRFRELDDTWLRRIFFDALLFLEDHERLGNPLNPELRHLRVLLDSFLFRNISHAISLWKHIADHAIWCDRLAREIARIHGLSEIEVRATISRVFCCSRTPDEDPDGLKTRFLDLLEAKLGDIHVRLLVDIARPRVPSLKVREDTLQIIAAEDHNQVPTVKNLLDISPYIRHLSEAGGDYPKVQIFLIGANLRSDKEKIKEAVNAVFTCAMEWIVGILSVGTNSSGE